MNKQKLLKEIIDIVRPVVVDLGYEFYHLEIVKEDGEYFLRVYIDSENGITLEDCEKVSRPLSDILDEKDPIPYAYYLEVSSPGIYRILYNDNHLSKVIGSKVKIKLNSLLDDSKEIVGVLKSYNDASVTLIKEECDIAVPREKITTISLDDNE